MNIAELARPEVSEPIDPKDEIRFPYMANPFHMKSNRAMKNPDYVAFRMSNWHLPPPLPGPGDMGESLLSIPMTWYWLAVGCEDCVAPSDKAAYPVIFPLWAQAHATNRREIAIGEEFLAEWSLEFRSIDRVLKRLHKKSLLVYAIHNTKHNNVILLATPTLEE
ncbi:hypothetical protein Mal15_42570 [Stieleria maiorica]|uniref:Uncharacterized protein n=1 Tax=Stieleria maiorica TaxID=2795974 RepID=A0A5B9MMU2_9BACT|nr:hypothetical protein [Stieleria maiorica]QEG00188.1 hypothetical protein Mal15_42570 [Stieleria maiorica]